MPTTNAPRRWTGRYPAEELPGKPPGDMHLVLIRYPKLDAQERCGLWCRSSRDHEQVTRPRSSEFNEGSPFSAEVHTRTIQGARARHSEPLETRRRPLLSLHQPTGLHCGL